MHTSITPERVMKGSRANKDKSRRMNERIGRKDGPWWQRSPPGPRGGARLRPGASERPMGR